MSEHSDSEIVFRAHRAVVGSEVVPAAVTVSGGRIAAVDVGPSSLAAAPPAGARGVDLDAEVVLLPGLVDTHVHVNEPGRTDWEGFASATRAAACGGGNTLIDMPLNSSPATNDPHALDAQVASTPGKAVADTRLWGGAGAENPGRLREAGDRGGVGL